jgi:hypothetical protein
LRTSSRKKNEAEARHVVHIYNASTWKAEIAQAGLGYIERPSVKTQKGRERGAENKEDYLRKVTY